VPFAEPAGSWLHKLPRLAVGGKFLPPAAAFVAESLG